MLQPPRPGRPACPIWPILLLEGRGSASDEGWEVAALVLDHDWHRHRRARRLLTNQERRRRCARRQWDVNAARQVGLAVWDVDQATGDVPEAKAAQAIRRGGGVGTGRERHAQRRALPRNRRLDWRPWRAARFQIFQSRSSKKNVNVCVLIVVTRPEN